ncbi:bifunctional 3-phenylpropionate/cinnamic acid dioxygenase ferredoxin subunit [Pseudonocardia sp. KRD-184]|uniref:Bifunctional 3-phenylpropionate/cinnamic acid dioxygenase ferredoxin subunit n=1 Tax=Pseudonocardia oceani TaxID=2792013 RepID=A0ABS6U317_9PSEU|nr:bifunctional 3-phenylpropionate/cinnamic acid dioxygenase ferredoxin subunit [Pseudonocardia oceani]MBW0088151.1 bifunctional 3-phenylpropionate/cinnamic acid dioxygenase ferredoxin subunit [Pseudonocardia oceani]MBW0095082.1 bifunctional 3-phenylpropionate/cinnamic acid dioxygenase ferredoxin subunit [Pseudonocardia oceani]MBW0107181.1 bifunctional 3-phenylpropionate/cinnamic acid dioxygenase ferredoxin subunit [Pseudonocardia oceani]MBW0119723.1 bifunctional 3-phenylpropionate/cinnamic aci
MNAAAPSPTVTLCPAGDLPPGAVRVAEITPPIAVFNVDGVLYAIDDTCSHAQASLADGDVDGCHVECPFHASAFDLRTGEPDGLPASLPVRTHAVEVRDGMVVVLVGVSPAGRAGEPGT